MAIVAIVGLDGCGKTTQARMLVRGLREAGHDSIYVEPVLLLLNLLTESQPNRFTSLLSPRKARTSIESRSQEDSQRPRRVVLGFLAYLYALLTYLLMVRYSAKRRIVVCDRYFYQFFFDSFGNYADAVIDVFPKPDMTFYLDGRVDYLHERMDDPSDVSTSKSYFFKVEEMFNRISGKYGFVRVDADLSPDSIGGLLLKKVANV
ncbi:MAG: hypothetical protein KAW09_10410 [Thermoplasmata archaeon]|nr:hypothetical protein [Thermoplasmata archaeon]